ncbi:apoptosis-associated speck-like protein containing a CARD [Lissotriton helveticus]
MAKYLILGALRKLGGDHFQEFKQRLSDENPADSSQKIGWGLLEKAMSLDVATLINDRYTEGTGLELTAKILANMGLKDNVKQLQETWADSEENKGAGPDQR